MQALSQPTCDESGEEDFLSSMVQVNYSKLSEDESTANSAQSTGNIPRALVATDYHVLLLLKSSVKAVNILNEGIVYDDNYNEVRFNRELDMCIVNCKVTEAVG